MVLIQGYYETSEVPIKRFKVWEKTTIKCLTNESFKILDSIHAI